jgi:hypothetical protein
MQKLLGSREEVALEAVQQMMVVDLSRVTNKSGFFSSIIKRIDMERIAVRRLTRRAPPARGSPGVRRTRAGRRLPPRLLAPRVRPKAAGWVSRLLTR